MPAEGVLVVVRYGTVSLFCAFPQLFVSFAILSSGLAKRILIKAGHLRSFATSRSCYAEHPNFP